MRKYFRLILTLVLTLVLTTVVTAQTTVTPILRGLLQTDLNGGGKKITNLVDITDSVGHSLLSGSKVKLSATDTNSNYLLQKLLPGSNITFQTNNVGGNESVTIASTGGGGGSTALYGNGSPAGTVAAMPGTSYLDTNQISFYVKTNGSGSAGWFWLIRGRQ